MKKFLQIMGIIKCRIFGKHEIRVFTKGWYCDRCGMGRMYEGWRFYNLRNIMNEVSYHIEDTKGNILVIWGEVKI